jgi:predicted transcriptional regulator
MPGDMESFISMLRSMKSEKGLSNAALAKIFGVDQSAISLWVRKGKAGRERLGEYWRKLQDYIDGNDAKENKIEARIDSSLNVTGLKITPISTTGALDKLVNEEERLMLEIDRLTSRIEKVKSAKEILRELAAN